MHQSVLASLRCVNAPESSSERGSPRRTHPQTVVAMAIWGPTLCRTILRKIFDLQGFTGASIRPVQSFSYGCGGCLHMARKCAYPNQAWTRICDLFFLASPQPPLQVHRMYTDASGFLLARTPVTGAESMGRHPDHESVRRSLPPVRGYGLENRFS